MALFGKKKTEEKAVKAPKAKAASVAVAQTKAPMSGAKVLLRPRITEKATVKADAENVYVFEIADDANKTTVRQAIISLYNVTPVKIAVARNPRKKHFARGKAGFTSGVKKAYVYVKKGEKIEIV